jgi:uncharacterized protein (DUF488 family)
VSDLFTVGHSNQDLDSLTGLLRTHMVEAVADVRSQPFSQFSPQFNRPVLQPALEDQGFRYLFLGRELGGRPEEASFYDDNGHVLYWKLARSGPFVEGLANLEELVGIARVAILCSEEDPGECHRRLLVGRVLMRRGCQIRHIRGDGRLQDEDELPDILGTRQPTLFGEPSEEVTWRSIRSVSPRRQPRSSSAS